VSGVPWRIITGYGLDDSISWQLLLQSLIITINYKNSQSIFSRTLPTWLPRTRSVQRLTSLLLWLTWLWFTSHSLLIYERLLIYDCTDCRLQHEWIPLYRRTTYRVSRRTHRKHHLLFRSVYCALRTNEHSTDYRNHRSCIVGRVFTEPLPSNRTIRHNIFRSKRKKRIIKWLLWPRWEGDISCYGLFISITVGLLNSMFNFSFCLTCICYSC
jgi:hypothetical protein